MNQPSAEQIRIWTARIAESDRHAFEQFFRRMYPRLVQFACRYTRSKPEASDIVQDAFVILWEKRREADPQQSLKAYIYRIVRNRALNHLRDHSHRTVGLEALKNKPQSLPNVRNASIDESHLMGKMKQWIDDLPTRRQEAFKLSRFEGLDHDEIAQVMEISSNTVNNHIVAALEQLRSRYDMHKQEKQ